MKQQHNRHNKNCKHVLSLSLSRELFFYFESLLLMATIFTGCLEHNKKIQIESDKSC